VVIEFTQRRLHPLIHAPFALEICRRGRELLSKVRERFFPGARIKRSGVRSVQKFFYIRLQMLYHLKKSTLSFMLVPIEGREMQKKSIYMVGANNILFSNFFTMYD